VLALALIGARALAGDGLLFPDERRDDEVRVTQVFRVPVTRSVGEIIATPFDPIPYVSRLSTRPVGMSAEGLNPATIDAYAQEIASAGHVAELEAGSASVRAALAALFDAATYPEVPVAKLRVPPGFANAARDRMAAMRAPAERAALAELDVDGLITRLTAAERGEGGLAAIRTWAEGDWLRPLDVALAIERERERSARHIVGIALGGATRPLTSGELLLLAELRLRDAEESPPSKSGFIDLSPVLGICDQYDAAFGDQDPYAADMLYLCATTASRSDGGRFGFGRADAWLARLVLLDPPEPIGSEARFRRAASLFEGAFYDDAAPLFAAVAAKPGPLRQQATYELGVCEFRENEVDAALDAFAAILADPSAEHGNALDFVASGLLAHTDRVGGTLGDTVHAWLAARPDSAGFAGELTAALGLVAVDLGRTDAAPLLDEVVNTWPDSPRRPAVELARVQLARWAAGGDDFQRVQDAAERARGAVASDAAWWKQASVGDRVRAAEARDDLDAQMCALSAVEAATDTQPIGADRLAAVRVAATWCDRAEADGALAEVRGYAVWTALAHSDRDAAARIARVNDAGVTKLCREQPNHGAELPGCRP
jgi:hypothetical protein